MQNKKRKIRKVLLFTFLIYSSFIITSNMGYNSIDEDGSFLQENTDNFSEVSLNPQISAIPVIEESYFLENISQFNISESTVYFSNDNDLDIKNENLTMDIPKNWNGNQFVMNISSIFDRADIFENSSSNGNFTDSSYPWTELSNYPEPIDPFTEPGVSFSHNSTFDFAYADYSGGTDIPPDIFGYYQNKISGFNKQNSEVEFGELLESETSDYPIWDGFIENPLFDVLIDPYGTDKMDSLVYAEWVSSVDTLETTIDTSSSFFGKGDPSVAFTIDFFIPFEADSVEIIFGWGVENLGYDKRDKFQVKSRIDGDYIDGRTGIYLGEEPGVNMTDIGHATSLERDFDPGTEKSHGVYPVYFNVTNMIGGIGYRKGWHQLDFGCYMEAPKDVSADVSVYWDFVLINVTHYDFYKAAEISFQYLITDLSGGDSNPEEDLSMVVYIGGNENPQLNMRFFVNETSDLVHGDDWNSEKVDITINFPHIYESAFRVNDFYLTVGLEKSPKFYGSDPIVSENPFYKRLSIDTFELNVNYRLGTPLSLGLEIKIAGEENWTIVDDDNLINLSISIPSPSITLEFNLTEENHPDPHLRYNSWLFVNKFTEKGAEATVSIERYSDISSFWNISFDNTNSITEIDNTSFTHNNFLYYRFTFENLPALDGLGNTSLDWNINEVRGPYWWNATDQSSKSSSNNFLQNYTVNGATFGSPGNMIRGIWQVFAYQMNYMVNGNMSHGDGSSTEKYYNGENANYTLQVRNYSGLESHYNVTLLNHDNDYVSEFPKHNNTTENLTQTWTVTDEGVGIYKLYTVFNDTNSENQTTRIGWWKNTFQMWRKTTARIIDDPAGKSVSSGDLITYTIEYNYTLNDTGVVDAWMNAHRNETGTLWGRDWPPYNYRIHSLTYIGDGQYNITLKTAGIPKDNYKVYFVMGGSFPFYDYNFTDAIWLNITGTLGNIKITYTYGAFNSTPNDGSLYSWNYPYVNDTENSIIQFRLENESELIRDAYISASINGSEEVMIAIEQYAFTHLDEDKGLYNLTLDTTGLNATDQSNIFNYTLEISFSKSGFIPSFHNITVDVKLVPLYIEVQPINDIYEGESIDLESSLSLNKSISLEPYNSAALYWSLFNNNSEFVMGGSLENVLSNFYSAHIEFSGSNFVDPGQYTIVINGSGVNLETTNSSVLNFTIYAKFVSNLSLIIPEEVRIGGHFSIAAKLTYIINETEISNKDVLFTINYSDTYSFQVVVQTEENGKAAYEMLIPSYQEGNDFTVYAEFLGSGLILPSSVLDQQEILGRIPVNISIGEPNIVRTGYNSTFSMNLSISGEQNYEGKIVFMFGFYDNNTQPFIIRELSTNENGSTSYTIDEIENLRNNITIFFEFLGDNQVENAIANVTCLILPKWEINITIDDFPNDIRIGQDIEFNITGDFLNSSSPETFYGLPLEIKFDYGPGSLIVEDFFAENNTIENFPFTIPQDCGISLNITLTFGGTNRIQNLQVTYPYVVLPKWEINITIGDFPNDIRIGQDIKFNITGDFLNSSSPETLYGLLLEIIFDYGTDFLIAEEFFAENGTIENFPFTIPQDCGVSLNITLTFGGTNRIQTFQVTYPYVVLPKWEINITIGDFPNDIRIGQDIKFNITGDFLNSSSPETLYGLLLEIIFDYGTDFLIAEEFFAENGTIENFPFTIPQDCGVSLNITLMFGGTNRIQNFQVTYPYVVLPKWSSYFIYENFSDIIKLGQTLSINFTLKSDDLGFSENFIGASVDFIFNYPGSQVPFPNIITDENGSIYFTYNIPDQGVNELNFSATYLGNNKISGNNYTISLEILPKTQISIKIHSFTVGQQFSGTYLYSANLTDDLENPLHGITLKFNVYDLDGNLVDTFVGVTNEYGFVSVSVELLETGDYLIKVEFEGVGIFAGNESEEISVHIVTYLTLFFEALPYILIGIGAMIGFAFVAKKTIVEPRAKRRMEALQLIHQRFSDSENIQYILILTQTGVAIFSKSFTNVPVDENLISGFLTAISSFGEEIGGKIDGNQGPKGKKGLEQLSYSRFKIIISDSALSRVALLLLKDASPGLSEKAKRFNFAFQEKYLDVLQNWTGKIPEEAPILEMVERYLEVDLLYPHNINLGKIGSFMETLDKKSIERLILDEAQKEDFNNTFYIREMIHRLMEQDKKEVVVFNAIDNLRNESAIFAINPRTQFLIDQFKPIIARLSNDSKLILNKIFEGVTLEFNLRKTKGITNFSESHTILKDMNLIDENNNLTDSGEAVATLLKIIERS